MIVPFLFGIDTISIQSKNTNHLDYISPTIKNAGEYNLQVNIFIDSTFYSTKKMVYVKD